MTLKRLLGSILIFLVLSASLFAADQVRLQTNHGDIIIKLYSDDAPLTVANFLSYVRQGRYDHTVIHRIVKGFVIQGGGYKIENNTMRHIQTRGNVKSEADNGLYNVKGTIAMARLGSDPHSATSEFFINLVTNTELNYKGEGSLGTSYTVFGKVAAGWDVVEKIASLPVVSKGGAFTHWAEPPVIILKAEEVNEKKGHDK
jgi:cyclophilin family peptidyl-prolyl cis-trans isomerase